ncbi:MAG TPA: DDE-type integrase/transposase/recombinase [Acidimicrobiales bacterium]|nr:DDE-type integrase/transposase/recombinase [Acidimicrobiales bacterium]
MPPDPAEAIAFFRFHLIAEAANPAISAAERGLIIKGLASFAHQHPDGTQRSYSRGILDRWVRAYRAAGLAGLAPNPTIRHRGGAPPPELLAEAAALRAEVPARSSGAIADIIWRRHGVAVSERTIRAHLHRRGLHRAAMAGVPRAFGRYEAEHPNQRWITDVLIGPFVPHPRVPGSRRAKLFLIVDDHSRLLVHGRFVSEENTRAGQDVLREAIARRGLPQVLYADNGAPFANAALERSCAVLGIRLVHSRPYSPAGRGKQERLNRYIRQRFLAEAEAVGIESFEILNDRFMAWAEQVCNTRTHAETNETPIARFMAGGPPRAADPPVVADAFRWSAIRLVTKTACVSLAGNRYQVDPVLVGRRVECRYDPTDMSSLDVFFEGRAAGVATPLVIGAHVHPAVPQARRPDPEPTGIDYLGLVLAAHDEATAGSISYRDVPLFGDDTQDDDGDDGDDGDEFAGARR